MKLLEDLQEIMAEGRWIEFARRIKCVGVLDDIYCEKCCGRHSLTHLVCKHNPPLYILKSIAEINPSSFTQTDCEGQLPLHIILNNGSTLERISYVLSQNEDAASATDKDGMSAVHLLLRTYHKNKKRYAKKSVVHDHFFEFLKHICEIAPETVLALDENGVSPVEYAIVEELEERIVNFLQSSARVASIDMKNRSNRRKACRRCNSCSRTSKFLNIILRLDQLTDLLTKQKWDEFIFNVEELGIEDMKCNRCTGSHSLLHSVCHFNAPISVMKRIAQLNPTAYSQTNCRGQLPLHVALNSGSTIERINYIIGQNRLAMSIADKNGSYPIHLFICNYHKYHSRYASSKEIAAMKFFQFLKFMCSLAPRTILAVDISGNNALDYAIKGEHNEKVIKFLQEQAEISKNELRETLKNYRTDVQKRVKARKRTLHTRQESICKDWKRIPHVLLQVYAMAA